MPVNVRLDPCAEAVDRAVDIQQRTDRRAERHGHDDNQDAPARTRTRNADIQHAQPKADHDRFAHPLGDAPPKQQADRPAARNGQRVDNSARQTHIRSAPSRRAALPPYLNKVSSIGHGLIKMHRLR